MKKHIRHLLATISIAALAACGGGGGGSSSPATSSLSGTAAVGAPLPNATVTLKDADGKTRTTTAGTDGAYVFADVSGLKAPLMLQATGTAGGTSYTLYSLLETVPATGVSGVVNITPATDAVTAQAVGADPASVFADATKIKAVETQKLADAKARLNAALKDVLTALGQDPAKVDLFTTKFAANSTGLDKLLDLVAMSSEAKGTGATQTRDIKITDKSSQTTTTIDSQTAAKDVPPVASPSATGLDLSGIKTLLASFNALTGSAASIRSDAMKELFDVAYLQEGMDRAAQLEDIANNAVGVQFSDYVVNGCEDSTKVCQGQVTVKMGTYIKTFRLPVKLGTDSKWRAYGDQSPLQFEFKPVAFQQTTVGTDALPGTSTTKSGFNLWLTGVVGNNESAARTYRSAKLFISEDGGTHWVERLKLNEKTACANTEWLPVDDASDTNNANNCSNSSLFSDRDASAIDSFNTAQAQGNARFKIVLYPNANYTGTTKEFSNRAAQQLFTSSTAAAAITNSGLGITTSELGTNSVSFTGKPNSVYIQTASTSGGTGNTSWDGPTKVTPLNGKATVAAAKAQCGTAATCGTTYGDTAKINFIYLGTYDRQGRGIWVQWRKN